MFNSDSNQIKINLLINIFNYLQSLNIKLNSISIMMNKLTIINQSTVSEMTS